MHFPDITCLYSTPCLCYSPPSQCCIQHRVCATHPHYSAVFNTVSMLLTPITVLYSRCTIANDYKVSCCHGLLLRMSWCVLSSYSRQTTRIRTNIPTRAYTPAHIHTPIHLHTYTHTHARDHLSLSLILCA